jgi:hypothetical protein
MFSKFKNALLIVIGIAVIVQLSGCVFVHRDRPRRNEHQEHHDSVRGPELDIRIH